MTPGKLVFVVKDALGVDINAVTQLDQKLAAAGLRSKSGRGPSAADVTARDAATLVLAVLAQADVATNRRDGRTLEKALEIANATVMPGQPEMPDLPEFCKVVNSQGCAARRCPRGVHHGFAGPADCWPLSQERGFFLWKSSGRRL